MHSYFPEREKWMVGNKKGCSVSLVIKGMPVNKSTHKNPDAI